MGRRRGIGCPSGSLLSLLFVSWWACGCRRVEGEETVKGVGAEGFPRYNGCAVEGLVLAVLCLQWEKLGRSRDGESVSEYAVL